MQGVTDDTSTETHARCPVCGDLVALDEAIACSSCSAPHHQDCWDYHGGCSLFGCGSRDSIEFEAIRASLESGEIAITERTRPPVRWDAVREGLVRKLRTRARDVPRTLVTGLAGAAASVACYLLFNPARGEPTMLYLAIFLTGGLYGLLSPFMAPTQIRRPGRMATAGLVSFVGLYLFGEWLHISGDWALALIVPLFFFAFVFASSTSEWLAGTRTALGERLGRAALPVRLALGWLGAVGLMVGTLVIDRHGALPSLWVLKEIALWGLLAVGTTMPALEQGKSRYLEALPELTED